jgi:hypothetical protein
MPSSALILLIRATHDTTPARVPVADDPARWPSQAYLAAARSERSALYAMTCGSRIAFSLP